MQRRIPEKTSIRKLPKLENVYKGHQASKSLLERSRALTSVKPSPPKGREIHLEEKLTLYISRSKMKPTLFTLPLLALSVQTASAWKVWINWANNCGGDSYVSSPTRYNTFCFTWFTSGESGCTATIYTGLNCGGSAIDATTVDGTCLLGRFQSYSVNCF
ncbi:hypothetical protein B0O99DRAFT_636200 [Bisporella sp. PMI_857]|nr:hypothetical protein B0O99DRAFT_636200 [Bisporella sp. PMI_857]